MSEANWYTLYAKPHKELIVSRQLEGRGYQLHLPLIGVKRRLRQKFMPSFSFYPFARLKGARESSQVRWTTGLRRIVSFGGRPPIVPDEVIDLIKERFAVFEELRYPFPLINPGGRVRITAGTLADFEGVFERAQLLVHLLGRWTRCELEFESLTKVY